MIPTTHNYSGDEISRAMSRNGVHRGSPLERHIRARAYDIWYGWLGAECSESKDRDVRMDEYIRDQKDNLEFMGSFMPDAPEKRIAMTDQQALFNADINKIARGEIEVYDPRERPPR